MRIAHIVARFPPDVGGMGEVARSEAEELARRGHQVTVFFLTPRCGSVSPSAREGVGGVGAFRLVHLTSLIPGGDAGWVPQLLGKLKNFDIVHLHYPFYGGAEWVWLAKALHNQKYVVTYHMQAAPTVGYRRLVQGVYDTFLTGTILEHAERVLIVDKNYFAQNRFLRVISPEKIIELTNGIDTGVFFPADEPVYNSLLFVGNLMPVKGIDILLQAVSQIPEAKLTVVGSGYEEAAYTKMAGDLGVRDRVTFVGSVVHHELGAYYRKAWVTIVPSSAESFSLVTLESMACGTPVVASDVIGIRGKIEDGVDGWLFGVAKTEELKMKISEVLRMSINTRKQMGERAVEKVKRMYSLEKHIEKLLKVYSEVAV